MNKDVASHIDALDSIIESLQRERMRLAHQFSAVSISNETGLKIAHAVLSQNEMRRASNQSRKWAGYVVAEALGFDLSEANAINKISRYLSDTVAMGFLAFGHERDTSKGRDMPVYVDP